MNKKRTIRIGRIQLGQVPRVVLVVNRDAGTLRNIAARGVSFLEARMDLFTNTNPDKLISQLKSLRRHGLPLIGTVRGAREGGGRNIPAAERSALYKKILPWVDAVDIEIASRSVIGAVGPDVRRRKKTLILSYHNFKVTPPDRVLADKVKIGKKLSADIVKIAVAARSGDDCLRMFDFTLRYKNKGLVTISMGTKGSISRILFASAGSLLTYTSPTPFDGQIPLRQLVHSLKLLYPKLNR